MIQIKQSLIDTDVFFNLNGLEYEKGKWGLIYNNDVSKGNVVDLDKVQIGIVSKATGTVLQTPVHYYEYADVSGISYGSYSTLLTDLAGFLGF